jgi:hypothetical protein
MMPAPADTRPGTRGVPAGPARDHVTALRQAGASYRGIARVVGQDHSYVTHLHRGRYATIRSDIADALLAVTADQATPPANRGGRSYPGHKRRIWADDLHVLIGGGAGRDDIVARLGLRRRDSLHAWCRRNGRMDLLDRAVANETQQAVA